MQSALAIKLDQSCAQTRQDRSHDLSNLLRSKSSHSSLSSPTQHRVEDMAEAIGTSRRNSGDSYEERSETRTSLQSRLVVHANEPAKVVAQKVGVSPDSIDAYRQKNVPQSWAQMIAFGRAYPGFALDVMEMMGIDIDRDRDSYAMFLALQKQVRGG